MSATFKKTYDTLDTGLKLSKHKIFRRPPGHLLKVLRAFKLRPLFRGDICFYNAQMLSNYKSQTLIHAQQHTF